MISRRKYPVFILFNGRVFNEIRISSHYEKKHSRYMSDELILGLVKRLNRENAVIQKRTADWNYFELNREHQGKLYRLILCTSDLESFIGVVNCYRSK